MERLAIEEFAGIAGGELRGLPGPGFITNVSIDSRRVSQESAFFALKGSRCDGHQFVQDALTNGCAAAVVTRDWAGSTSSPIRGSLVAVRNPLQSLQALAAWWRRQVAGEVLAVTGSNGKTIVKDALLQILSTRYYSSASPGSFNSQIGVPLSVIRIPRRCDYAIIEAGVSCPGEMSRLEEIIRPVYGLLTNIGVAHISSFQTRLAIAEEKVRLFRNLPAGGWLLAPAADQVVDRVVGSLDCRVYRFGSPSDQIPYLASRHPTADKTRMVMRFPSGQTIKPLISTPSPQIVSDVEMAVSAAYLLGVEPDGIEQALSGYTPPTTRMEIWNSPSGVTLINDSCSSDPISVSAALASLALRQATGRKIFVFGGMRELGALEREEHAQAGLLAAQSNVDTLVLVGDSGVEATEEAFRAAAPGRPVIRCKSSDQVKGRLLPLQRGDTVLVKGPRNTGIARAATQIVEAMAPSRFIVDLQSVGENLTRFQRLVGPSTRVLAMVKALAYGTDATRLALEFQRLGVECLGVASADEGGALRSAGVDLPILVMMCTPDEAEKVVRHHLTPVVYSFGLVEALSSAARDRGDVLNVHMEVDTGLNRVGVTPDAALELACRIARAGSLRPVGLMTHFASADDPDQDDFTRRQIRLFRHTMESLKEAGFTGLICHAGATAGAVRFPEARFDMVRIGLGMYGIYPSSAVAEKIDLDLAVALVSRVVEVRVLPRGAQVGYGSTFVVPSDGYRVGVVPIGYHDGIPWVLSNRGSALVGGRPAPIVGRISMDSMIVDLSAATDVEPWSDVIVYGKYGGYAVRPEHVAADCGTIPYELLTRLGPRIQRIFIGQSP